MAHFGFKLKGVYNIWKLSSFLEEYRESDQYRKQDFLLGGRGKAKILKYFFFSYCINFFNTNKPTFDP